VRRLTRIGTVRATDSPDGGLRVSDSVVIPRAELEVRVTRSGGPGGQHVNTSSTRVEMVWNVRTSEAITDEQRARIEQAFGTRLSARGALRVVSSDTRSQRQNRELAGQRLAAAVRKALTVEKPRTRTRPHRAAVEARLAGKKRRAGKKRDRRFQAED